MTTEPRPPSKRSMPNKRQTTVEQRLAAFDEFFGIAAGAAKFDDSDLYDDRGMPRSDEEDT